MRVLIQRVRQASVKVDEKITGEIKQGFLLLVGFENADTDEDLTWTANKISALRIFDDENGVMNKSILEVDGEILCVSQFTLFAMTKKETDLPTSKQQKVKSPNHSTINFAKN